MQSENYKRSSPTVKHSINRFINRYGKFEYNAVAVVLTHFY